MPVTGHSRKMLTSPQVLVKTKITRVVEKIDMIFATDPKFNTMQNLQYRQ